MNVVERFLKYVSYDTTSDPNSETTPTSNRQLKLAEKLVEEMKAIGMSEAHVDAFGVVYGWINANVESETPSIGLIAHMDTSPDMCGAQIKPRIVERYDGGDIILNESLGIVLSPKSFDSLKLHIGKDLIVTDGTTLLGADDKAGVAEIMTMAERIIKEDIPHGKICIAFTPDEEVGKGTDHFDVEKFGADFAYTVDGGGVEQINYENFHAASASVHIKGNVIHPGYAKNKMRNASCIAMEFHQMLPQFENPACTEGYEGFHHLHGMQGDCESCDMTYIIRNHDKAIFERQKTDFLHAAAFLNQKYGEDIVTCLIQDQYINMRAFIEQRKDILERVENAMKKCNIAYRYEPIRGGTDGARLTYMGLPCPNLGTGGYHCHGRYEYACIDEMKLAVDVLTKIVKLSS